MVGKKSFNKAECRSRDSQSDDTEIAVEEKRFLEVIRGRHSKLLAAALYMEEVIEPPPVLTRPLLALILSETEQLEELLDAYGARYNSRWLVFRELIAAARIISRVGYTILHIQHSLARYHLKIQKGSIAKDTEQAVGYLSISLAAVMTQLMKHARSMGLESHLEIYPDDYYSENLPPGRLPSDRRTRHVEEAEQTLLMLATECLAMTARSSFLHTPDAESPSRYRSYIPDPVSEESLRMLEYHFHNLQSLYDTYLLGTDLEAADPGLPELRGHISMIFHLLQAATWSVHFYERHVLLSPRDFNVIEACDLNVDRLLRFVVGYCVVYASSYIRETRLLCQHILNKYTEITTVEVPVPAYRGFHVRPATLVAKIIQHYGSHVTMELHGQKYDAGNTLDLFRANESINAEKRRRIAERIEALPKRPAETGPEGRIRAVRGTILALAERNELVIYQHPLPIESHLAGKEQVEEDLQDFIIESVKRLLALGKIDLECQVKAKFTGDKRILNDLRLLAENGYGEDRFGNNIPLPSELNYLRRAPW
ncbi:MAG: HPr family phosphocarrier protein [Lentisphaeria bacterium]